MQALAVTSRGIEGIAALEIKELIKADCTIKDSCVIFNPKKLTDLCLLSYKTQSLSRVLFLFDHFEFKNGNNLLSKINLKKIKFSKWLNKESTFMVKCQRVGAHNFSSMYIEQNIGELIFNRIKNKVNLKNPDVVFYVYIYYNNLYIGIDLSGFDLSKRQYKLFNHPSDIKATIAYALVRLSGFKHNEILLDPFCKCGVIPIESALFASNLPVNYFSKDKFSFLKLKPLKKLNFDKFFSGINSKTKQGYKNIFGYEDSPYYTISAKKNAKIAGVNKAIEFSNMNVEWLDTHFKEKAVNKIVTYPPILSKRAKKDVSKLYQELFYQANYCLAKNGKIAIISKETNLLKENAGKYNFKPIEERRVWMGEMGMNIIIFGRVL